MKVKLLYAVLRPSFAPYGTYTGFDANIEIVNLGPQREVSVVLSTGDIGQASFVCQLPNGRELWTYHHALPGCTKYPHYRFAVQYVANGHTYWDNNGGWDYCLDWHSDIALGDKAFVVRCAGLRSAPAGTETRQEFYGQISIRGCAEGGDDVKVVFTEDDWKTTRELPAQFQSRNDFGIETWVFSTGIGAHTRDVEFSVSRTRSGVVDSINNYGANYRVQPSEQPECFV